MDSNGSQRAMWSGTKPAEPAPQFKTTRRGFEQSEVLAYIGQMNDRLKTGENLVRQLRAEVEQAQYQRDTALRERDELVQQRDEALAGRTSAEESTYEQLSERVTKLLVALDTDVEQIRADAQAEARRIVADAKSEADRLRLEAHDESAAATQSARQAREDLERSVADMTSRRDRIRAELRRTCSDFLEVIGGLAASIEGESDTPAERNGDAEQRVVIPDMMPDRPA